MLWPNADLASGVVKFVSAAVVFVAVADLTFDEWEYRRGRAEKPKPRKRLIAFVLALLGVVGFFLTNHADRLRDVENRKVDAAINAAAQMRLGMRWGLDELTKITNDPTSSQVRERARSLLSSVAADYERFVQREIEGAGAKTAWDMLEWYDWSSLRKLSDPAPALVGIIRTEQDLHKVAVAFAIFREKTGAQVKMFDTGGIDGWCGTHPARCSR